MSWALRSLLSRPHPLLLSRLRPVLRRASHPTAVLGSRRNLIGSRGYASSSSGDLHAEVKKRHLYVVLDDHEFVYGIHKLDLRGCDDDQDDRLPEPPVLRVAISTVSERAKFAGVGSSIFAVGPSLHMGCWDDYCSFRMIFIYDTETAALEVAAATAVPYDISSDLGEQRHKEAAVAFGGRLYMLESGPGPVWISYQRQRNGDGGGEHSPHSVVDGGSRWSSWEPLSDYSRWSWSVQQHSWNPLTPPFRAEDVTAWAAHPPAQDEHEIVVSVRATHDGDGRSLRAGTFFFSTASLEWTRLGDWEMPVHGHAHFDGGLDAWVGLHAVYDGVLDVDRPRVPDGCLCVGRITSAPTQWKVGGEKLLRIDEDIAAGWRHLDAKLVPMAPREGGGEYCLMERLVLPKGDKEGDGDDEYECSGDKHEWLAEEKECLLRLTAFRVERGHDGEPVATARRPARVYRVSRYNRYFDPQAFWM